MENMMAMKKSLILLTMALLMLGCSYTTKEEQAYKLHGAWILQHATYPEGKTEEYAMEGKGTYCLIYDRDSMLYQCSIVTTPSGLVIKPTWKCVVTLINKGGGEWLYLENGDPHPLIMGNDSTRVEKHGMGIPTITIQRSGILYTCFRADDIYQEWGSDICDIIANELEKEDTYGSNCYVLSTKERQQERTIQWFGYFSAFIILISLVAAHLVIVNRRAKRQLQYQLQQIQEVQINRPQAVRQVVETVEKSFFSSDEYAVLQKRMADGLVMKEEDWQQVEQHLKTIYPGFISQLRGLHQMSELEYQVCLLIKLRIAPKDIAAVLARDVSTISTVRSRLYKKVFGHKGGAKDWDDFVLSIGA